MTVDRTGAKNVRTREHENKLALAIHKEEEEILAGQERDGKLKS